MRKKTLPLILLSAISLSSCQVLELPGLDDLSDTDIADSPTAEAPSMPAEDESQASSESQETEEVSPNLPGTISCQASSTFDTDDEGWTIFGDAEEERITPDYHAEDGNPAGYVSADDDTTGAVWYWSAPPVFLGNQSQAHTLSFDLKQSSLNSQFDDSDLMLKGNGQTLVLDLENNPGTDWTPYQVSLTSEADWRVDSLAGEKASPETLQAVLSDLSQILIRGEYVEGSDTGSLDNVFLRGGACGAAPTQAPGLAITSDFDTENDGWLVVGDAEDGGGEPDYLAQGGNPNGHLSADDDAAGGTWYWSAPDKYLGDKTSAYGQQLSFELKQSSINAQFDDIDLILASDKMTLVLDLANNPGEDWTAYQVNLDTQMAWKKDSLDGDLASEDELRSVLGNLTRLWIRGEYVEGADTGGLDNVRLES